VKAQQHTFYVIFGLDPKIHKIARGRARSLLDARVKPEHDRKKTKGRFRPCRATAGWRGIKWYVIIPFKDRGGREPPDRTATMTLGHEEAWAR